MIQKSHNIDYGQTKIVHVADREGDRYELFRDAAALKENVLIRASRNRSVNKVKRREAPAEYLFDKLNAAPAQGHATVRIQINSQKKFRDVGLSIVWLNFTMPPPPNKTVRKDGPDLPVVPLHAVMAVETDPPEGQDPLQWVLLTNLAVNDVDQAIEKVNWYALRWNIEVFHKVLKSGCGAEQVQLRQGERLKRYVVLKSIVAWRLFWLSRMHQIDGGQACTAILSDTEWKVLYRKINKTRQLPPTPPTVREVFIWIARLGGYLARATDPDPGVVSLWRGWQRLSDMVDDFGDICG